MIFFFGCGEHIDFKQQTTNQLFITQCLLEKCFATAPN